MKKHGVVGLLLVALVALTCGRAEAVGIGGMIKKKAAAVVKGENKAPEPAAEAKDEGRITSRMSPPVTKEGIAKFKAAMEVERAEREKVVEFLASLKTPEEFDACRTKVMMSPEGQKISERMMAMGDKTTPQEAQKIMAAVGADLEKLILERCGEDPNTYSESRRGQMTRATEQAGAKAFGIGDDNTYYVWKEWVLAFCQYMAKLEKQPDGKEAIDRILKEGVRIPGDPAGKSKIFYVYTAEEAALLYPNCDELVALLKATS